MIRGLFIFLSSLILLSVSQIKLSLIENETTIQPGNSNELLTADLLTYEPIDHPGQLGNIRLLKQKTSKIRTNNNTFWFVSIRTRNQFQFDFFSVTVTTGTEQSSKILNAGALPLYLELNKLII